MPHDDFWSQVAGLEFSNEGDVEVYLVSPLLNALGYELEHIRAKYPIEFREGSKGRKSEADFVVFGAHPHSRTTSLLVVEAKRPGVSIDNAVSQAESYAIKVRAPLILATNGEVLKLLQLQATGENDLVFEAPVAELANHRGSLEHLAGPMAGRLLCQQLQNKRLDLLADDITAFETNEIERLSQHAASIERALRDTEKGELSYSRSLLTDFTRGAVITAASGYGKTTLAASLATQAIKSRWDGDHNAVVFELFLPDLSSQGGDLESFLADRMSRHLPSISVQSFKERMRRDGAVLVADGFERVDPDDRPKVVSEIRTFCRDYRVKAFILSRIAGGSLSSINLPLLELQPYGDEDLPHLISLKEVKEPRIFGIETGMPRHLEELCREPLLANLILDHIKKHGYYPTNVRPIFEGWLDRILGHFDVFERLMYRTLLTDIAVATRSTPISIGEAYQLASAFGDGRAVFARLLEAQAVSVGQTTIELYHEALADYLRALDFLESSKSDLEERLETATFEATSQFPRLLLAATRTPFENQTIWRAMVRANLPAAVEALKFTHGFGDLTPEGVLQKSSSAFFSDVVEAMDTVIDAHLKSVAPALRKALTGRDADQYGVNGQFDDRGVTYGFFEARADLPRIIDDPVKRPSRRFGIDLPALGLGPDAGRVIGVRAVRTALMDLIKDRRFSGGLTWTEELVVGRLMHLRNEYKLDIPLDFDLMKARSLLQPLSETTVSPIFQRRGQTFLMATLVKDIDYLLERGLQRIDRWWCDLDAIDIQREADQNRLAAALNAYISRRQKAYVDLVEHQFLTLQSILPKLQQLPMRREIEVELLSRSGHTEIVLEYRDHPVGQLKDAGADVSFPKVVSDWNSDDALRSHHIENLRRLEELGQNRPQFRTTSGWTTLRDFVLDRWSGDGLPDETIVVRDVMTWLTSDIQDLFKAVPGPR